MPRPFHLRFLEDKRLVEEMMPLGILYVKMQQTEPIRLRQVEGVGCGMVRLTIRTESTSHHRVAIVSENPVESDMILEIQEVVAVGNGEHTVINAFNECTSIVVLKFVVVGQRRTVGIQQTVCSFVTIHLETTVHGRKHPLLIAIATLQWRTERHSLVHPFPDRPTSDAWGAFYDFPLAVVVFERDSQCMQILREDDRAVSTLIEIGNLRGCGIVRRIDVRHFREVVVKATEIRANLWITDGTNTVELRLHIITQSDTDIRQWIFVAKTPNHHRWMVLIAEDGSLCTLLKHGIERGIRKVLVTIAKRHLIDDVETH